MGLLDELKQGTGEAQEGANFAQSWRWEKAGDGIEGVVVSTSSRTHENHPDGYPIVTVRDANGEDWSIHGMSYVLKDEITKRNLRPGDEFAVIYDGKKTSASGRGFHAFRVASKQGSGGAPAPAAAPVAQGQQAPAQAAANAPWGEDLPPF